MPTIQSPACDVVAGAPSEAWLAAARALAAVGESADPRPLVGLDPNSTVLRAGNHVGKVSGVVGLEAQFLTKALAAIHARLAPFGLAPHLSVLQVLPCGVLQVYQYIAPSGDHVWFGSGRALAQAHRLLAGIRPSTGWPWVGFYGESFEFRAIVPAITDADTREACLRLLPFCARSPSPDPAQYVHRDASPANTIPLPGGRACLIDWDMAHPGLPVDDLAMAVCMISDRESASLEEASEQFVAGYRAEVPYDWADLEHPSFRAALALAGLRQAGAGWFSDLGDSGAPYWEHVRRRTQAALQLITL